MLNLNALADADIHTLADFAELLCLSKPDRILSADDLEDHLVDEADATRGRVALDDCFAHLSWRATAFGSSYPFSIAENLRSFKTNETFTGNQAAYIFLLLCANLPRISRDKHRDLTDAFERASLCALRRIWPQHGEVRAFGKNNTDYQGRKSARLQTLGREIGGRPILSDQSFRKNDSGDGGIDLAAWITLDDFEIENKPSALVQCACSRDQWTSKQSEISHARLNKLLNPTAPWLEFMFMPICFRNNNGRWAVEADVASLIVVDRLRLIGFIDVTNDWNDISIQPLLDEVFDSMLDAA